MKKIQKLLWLMVILPLILIIPINAALIWGTRIWLVETRMEIVEEERTSLQRYVAMLDAEFDEVEQYMDILLEENYPFLQMAELDFSRNQEEFYEVQNLLIAEMRTRMAIMSRLYNTMMYFSASDTLLNNDKFEDKRVIDKFEDALMNFEDYPVISEKEDWRYISIDGKNYFARVYADEGARCMLTISEEGIFDELEQNDRNDLYSYSVSFDPKEQTSKLEFEDESKTVTVSAPLQYVDASVIGTAPVTRLDMLVPFNVRGLVLFAFMSCFIGPVLCLLLLYFVEKPLQQLNFAMNQMESGNEQYRIPVARKRLVGEFDELNIHYNHMMDELEERKIKLLAEEAERQKVQARYLNQQIRPHFILNALNLIYTYEDEQFPMAKELILYLTKYFRYLVNLKLDYACLWEEMEFMDNYLAIQKIRYPNRFDYYVEYEDFLEFAVIPAITIQPFVENSIKHGFEKGKTMLIFVLARKIDNNRVEILISDTGKGFSPEVLEEIHHFLNDRNYNAKIGVGIQNTIKRMDYLYSEDYSIYVDNNEDGGTKILMKIPLFIDETEKRNDKSITG